MGERQSIAQIRAIDPRKTAAGEMAKMLQTPGFALPGCQPMSVNTLLCDTLGLTEFSTPLCFSLKYPVFANRLANRPLFGLVCLGGFQFSLGEISLSVIILSTIVWA